MSGPGSVREAMVDSVVVGGSDLFLSEGHFANALAVALSKKPDVAFFLFGDPAALDGLQRRHDTTDAAVTVCVRAHGNSNLTNVIRRFGGTNYPRSAVALAISRPAAEAFLAVSCQTQIAAVPAVWMLLRAEGFQIEVMAHTGLTLATVAPTFRRGDHLQLRKRANEIASEHRRDQTKWSQRSSSFAGQEPVAGSQYAGGEELRALSKSYRFHRWMATLLGPAIGNPNASVLEVGAGLGTMTKALSETYPAAKILAIEPDPALSGALAQKVQGLNVETSIVSTHELDRTHTFDTVLYVNVLEHIEDHLGELKRAYELLKPGGRVGIIVPAIPSLYGSLDAKTGHFRRYEKASLGRVAEAAGFSVSELHYFDVVSVLPYWASIKVGSMPVLSDRTTYLFDNVLVPMSKLAHKCWKQPPIGKNLLLVGRKPN